MNFFTYNWQSSADFGLHIESKNVFSAPAFDATFQAIPGRNGDLIIPNNRFANASVSYTAFVAHRTIQSLADTLRAIRGWLFAEPDRYHPITDSYDTGFVRYGVIKEGLDIEEQLNRIGSFTVNFSCKPFRYSEAGNESVSVATSVYQPPVSPHNGQRRRHPHHTISRFKPHMDFFRYRWLCGGRL